MSRGPAYKKSPLDSMDISNVKARVFCLLNVESEILVQAPAVATVQGNQTVLWLLPQAPYAPSRPDDSIRSDRFRTSKFIRASYRTLVLIMP